MWSLNGGVALSYLGAWAAGTYQPGQIVVDNGVEYMCVRTTTKRPTGWPGSAATTYGTSLPASPVDGQEAVLVDSITNPQYVWRFRYNASSTQAYKWEFVGGYPYWTAVVGAENFNGINAWVDANTNVGPQIAAPRAGQYNISASASIASSTASAACYIGICIGAGSPVDPFQGFVGAGVANTYMTVAIPFGAGWFTAAQGDLIRMRYLAAAGSGSIAKRNLAIQPLRVS